MCSHTCGGEGKSLHSVFFVLRHSIIDLYIIFCLVLVNGVGILVPTVKLRTLSAMCFSHTSFARVQISSMASACSGSGASMHPGLWLHQCHFNYCADNLYLSMSQLIHFLCVPRSRIQEPGMRVPACSCGTEQEQSRNMFQLCSVPRSASPVFIRAIRTWSPILIATIGEAIQRIGSSNRKSSKNKKPGAHSWLIVARCL